MKFLPLALTTLLPCYLWAAATATAQTPLPSPTPGILALRNGQVISGKVLRDGDRYLVTLGESAEVRIEVAAVEFLGRSLPELYQFKHAALVPSDTAGQLRLAEWCIRHGLLSRATELLEETAAHQRTLPQWIDLQRRLKLAQRPRVSTSAAAPIPPLTDSKPDIDRLLAGLSSRNVQEFTSFVQPLLLNRCSTTTCHGALSKTRFKLIKPSRGRVIPTRYTQRNLYNTWQTLNSQQPDQSALINITTAPHGGTAALFTQREWDQYQRLVNWVRTVAKKEPAPSPDGIRQPSTLLAQPARPANTSAADNQQPASKRARALEKILSSPRLPLARTPAIASPADPKTLPNVTDPFDPAIFNRRFHADRFVSAKGSTDTAAKGNKSTPPLLPPTSEPAPPVKRQ